MANEPMKNTAGSATPASPPGAEETLYSHSFFDAELRQTRQLLTSTLLRPFAYLSICMWAVLSLAWGSTVSRGLSGLTVQVVSLNNESFGAQAIGAINSIVSRPGNHLDWVFDDTTKSDDGSRALVLNEGAWAVVQVNPNVLLNLNDALRSASTYDPASAMTIYYASARNEVTSRSKVLPAVLEVVEAALGRLGSEHTTQFLNSNQANNSAIQAALRCQACLASPFRAGQVDLIPFDVPTASTSTMVGMIFLLTFSFSIFQILHVNAGIVGAKIRLRDSIVFRILASLGAYVIFSLWYTLVNLAFGVPMGRVFGRSGFLVYWMLNACTMAALGTPMESLFTVIGLKWAGYFLSFWIIVNVAGSFQSFETISPFFSYGYGFPFFNSIQGARTIMFGTKSHLGQNFGILLAWTASGIIGMAVFTAWTLARNKKSGQHLIK